MTLRASTPSAAGRGSGVDHLAPLDEGNRAYLIFFVLGAGFLFPWNAFITAVDYFTELYPKAHVDRLFSLAYMIPSLGVLVLLMAFGRHYTSKARIFYGYCAFLCVLILIPILDWLLIDGDRGTTLSLVITVGAAFASGAIDAVVQGSLYGVAGDMPERYTQSLAGGTAASGVIVNILRMVTKAALPNTNRGLRASANLYFIFSAVFVGSCVVGFKYLEGLPVFSHYQSRKHLTSWPVHSEGGTDPSDDNVEDSTEVDVPFEANPSQTTAFLEPLFATEAIASVSKGMALQTHYSEVKFKDVINDIWIYAFTLTLVYIVTLSIFPGFLSEDVHSPALGDWYPVLLMFTYNITDLMGKVFPGFCAFPRTKYFLVGGAVARLLFYPLFALALLGPPFLRSELPVVLLTAGLGFTNGYFTAVLMMVAPGTVSLQRAEAAGIVMVLFLVIGLFLGSFSGWLWLL